MGTEFYKYLNTFGTVGGVAFTFFALTLPLDFLTKVTVVFLLGVPAIVVPLFIYAHTKKMMLEAGHSDRCSRKIARMYMLRASLWSEFKIMSDKDDGKRWWH